MKKNDWLIVISTAAYSFLFYNQSPGLNFFLFNLLLVILLAVHNRSALTQLSWLAAAAGCILSSFCVFWYGNALSILANLTSVLALGGLTFSAGTSLIIAGINSCFSVVVTIPYAIKGLFESSETEKEGVTVFFQNTGTVYSAGGNARFLFCVPGSQSGIRKIYR